MSRESALGLVQAPPLFDEWNDLILSLCHRVRSPRGYDASNLPTDSDDRVLVYFLFIGNNPAQLVRIGGAEGPKIEHDESAVAVRHGESAAPSNGGIVLGCICRAGVEPNESALRKRLVPDTPKAKPVLFARGYLSARINVLAHPPTSIAPPASVAARAFVHRSHPHVSGYSLGSFHGGGALARHWGQCDAGMSLRRRCPHTEHLDINHVSPSSHSFLASSLSARSWASSAALSISLRSDMALFASASSHLARRLASSIQIRLISSTACSAGRVMRSIYFPSLASRTAPIAELMASSIFGAR